MSEKQQVNHPSSDQDGLIKVMYKNFNWIISKYLDIMKRNNIQKSDNEFYNWLWSILDCKTRFFIISEISKRRGIAERKNQ